MDNDALGGEKVHENVRKRASKWDVVEDTQYSMKSVHANDKDMNHAAKWSDMEIDHTMRSKSLSTGSYREGKVNNADRGRERLSPNSKTWGEDERYGASATPRGDGWRERSHSRSLSRSRSPKSGWGRSRRSRSRSPYGIRHEAEGWAERGRSGRGGSASQCREFVAGRCRRGSQCRYLHQDDRDYDGRAHYDSGPIENRGRRQERGGISRHADDETFRDDPSGYTRDKFMQGYDHNDGDREKHERNNKSSSCNDFLKGKCHRGSTCRYAHHGANADGYGMTHNRRDDVSFGRAQRQDRTNDILCRYFLSGRCRNGDRCKFSHEGPRNGSPEEKHRDGEWGNDADSRNRSWESSKWSEMSGARIDRHENHSRNGPKWCEEASERNLSNNEVGHDPKWGEPASEKNLSNNQLSDGPNRGDKEDEKNASCSPWSDDDNTERGDGSKWNDKVAEANDINPHQWESHDAMQTGFPDSRPINLTGDGGDMPSAGTNKDNYPQGTQTQNPLTDEEQKQVLTSWMQHGVSGTASIEQRSGFKADVAIDPRKDHFKSINSRNKKSLSGNNAVTVSLPGQSSLESGLIQDIFPTTASFAQSSNSTNQNQPTVIPPNLHNAQKFNLSGQNQQMVSPLSSGPNVNHNGQSQTMALPTLSGHAVFNGQSRQTVMQPPLTLQSQTFLVHGHPSEKPNSSAANVSQNAVTTEKGSQITDLSASLAQIFGNGQKLPQLYATLNHLSAAGLVPSQPSSQSISIRPSVSTDAQFALTNQGCWSQNQYGSDSIKPDTNNEPQKFPMNPTEPNSSCTQKVQTLQQVLAPSITSGGNEGFLEKSDNEYLDKQHDSNMDAKPAQDEKDQQAGLVKDADVDDQVDEEGKRNKDAKVMRLFKFALVEFVKDLLKPTWKEGQMSKEVHKTIVKKVVDKVTSTMQGPNIPQTQEKIDQYLSYSKPKLTKLVHAYVEKYLKT